MKFYPKNCYYCTWNAMEYYSLTDIFHEWKIYNTTQHKLKINKETLSFLKVDSVNFQAAWKFPTLLQRSVLAIHKLLLA